MHHTVSLCRALSKLGILSRAQAAEAIRAGRVRVNGRIVGDPLAPIALERARIVVDGQPRSRAAWRTIILHKPRGIVTTRRDPEGRRTVYDLIGEPAEGLIPVGRLDLATSGLLLLTTDTRLANWITDPANGIVRVYAVTVRGRVTDDEVTRLMAGLMSGRDRLVAGSVVLRKASARESHLTIELKEGKNREARRLFEAITHEVTRLKRVRLGGLELGDLAPGQWRDLSAREVRAAFPRAPIASMTGNFVPSSRPGADRAV